MSVRSVFFVLSALFVNFALVPAATAAELSAKVKHGDLLLVAVGDVVTVTIDQVGLSQGEFRLTPGGGDTVNGTASAQVVTGVTRDVRFALKRTMIDASMPGVTIARDLRVAAGKGGGGTVLVQNFSVGRNVKVKNSGGLEMNLYTGTVGGKISWKGGRSFDDVDLRDLDVEGDVGVDLGGGDGLFRFVEGCDAARSIVVKAAATGAAMLPKQYFVKNSTIAGDLRFDVTGGSNEFQLDQIVVGRDIEIESGGGHDSVLITNWSGGRDLRVALGGGDNETTSSIGQLERDLELSGGNGVDQFASIDLVGVDRARIALAGSDDAVSLMSAFVAHSLIASTGGGDDSVSLAGMTIESDVKLLLGGDDNVANLATSFIGGDLVVKAGNGDDMVTVAPDVTVSGTQKFQTGGGTDSTP